MSPSSRAGQRGGLLQVVAEQEPEPVRRVADAPRRVEPGAEDEAEVAGADLFACEAAGLDQRAQPGPVALGQELESVPHQDAVLALERHHVGHGGERHQVEQIVGQIHREIERRHQRLHQLEGDAGAAEPGEPGDVVRPLRVHHRDGGWQLGAGEVVIGDHHADARGARLPHRLHRRDAAVAGDDQRGAGRAGRVEAGRSEVVAVAQTVGDERHDVRPGGAEGAGEHRGGALAVHVVVAVHQDGAAGAHGSGDGVHRFCHAGEDEGIGEIAERGTEIVARALHVGLTTLHQKGRQRLRQVQPLGQLEHETPVRPRSHHPAEDRSLGDAHHGSLTPGSVTRATSRPRVGTGSRRIPRSCPPRCRP